MENQSLVNIKMSKNTNETCTQVTIKEKANLKEEANEEETEEEEIVLEKKIVLH